MAILQRSVAVAVLVVPVALLFVVTPTVCQQQIQAIGYDMSSVTINSYAPQNVLSGNVLMLDNGVQQPGVLFAFSIFFHSSNPVILQLYRPTSTSTNTALTYQLLSMFTIVPAVQNGREDIYIESLLKRQFIVVLPGDRMAVYVTSDPPAVQTNFNASSGVIMYKTTQGAPRVGDTVTFDSTPFPYSIQAAAYVIPSNVSSSLPSDALDFAYGTLIPGTFNVIVTVPTTTPPPITGFPGMSGDTGPRGPQGETGATGGTGATGATGSRGLPGSLGLHGPLGGTGAKGMIGSPGPKGALGATGSMGASEKGYVGMMGPRGDPGSMGNNYTVYINRPSLANQDQGSADPYWSSTRAIWAMYLWLAIVSFFLLIVIIILIIIAVIHRHISRPTRTNSKAVRSVSNILSNTPSLQSGTTTRQ